MPSPFPGMDPYLENPENFPDFHDSFITYLRENVQANLPLPYYAALGRRVWIEASRRSMGPDEHVIRRLSCSTSKRSSTAVTTPALTPAKSSTARWELSRPSGRSKRPGLKGWCSVLRIESLRNVPRRRGDRSRHGQGVGSHGQ